MRGSVLSCRSIPAGLIILAGVWLAACNSPTPVRSAGPPPAVPVSVATAEIESVPVEVRAVGTVEASAVIQVKSQVSGELVKVAFEEGADVKQGDLLFVIDERPYQEALQQAQNALAKDTALLAQVQANLNRDAAQSKSLQADAARYSELARQGVVSKSQSEQSTAAAEAIQATIGADRAAIESATANIESDRTAISTARLNLSYCQIHAPVSGRSGNLLVHQGNLVAANAASPLVTINRIQPIWVSFGIPEMYLPAVRQSSASASLPVTVALQNDAKLSARGTLTVIDNTVDAATGTIKLKATFDNANGLLWPGQFVDASLTLGVEQNAVVVPAEAVQPGARGQVVYVVKPDQSVEIRQVTVGVIRGNKIVIDKGVEKGEKVVTDGQLRLFPGAKIRPVPADKVDSQTL
ncbi:MAG: efflux RND transporter periplasmic adaptor subunit [Terriglobia bacterium]|nr:MAG: efflux RND transporter periplasmic adaptor subunit [Terriglobia bacterium]